MKLSPDQITTLKKLISYKGYPEIDLQYEILDHVACKAEVLLEENPKLALDDAFRKVHSEFGIFGFSSLEKSYKKAIRKRVRNNYWTELKNLCTSYRIIYPLGLGVIIYQASLYLDDPQNWVLLFAGFLFLAFCWLVSQYGTKHKHYKNYASYQTLGNIWQWLNAAAMACIYSYQFVYSISNSEDTPALFSLIFQGIILTILVSFSISVFILPKILDQNIALTEKLKSLYEG
jgi:hypothetical protein